MFKNLIAGISGGLLLTMAVPVTAFANEMVVVTPTHRNGWTEAPPIADNRPVSSVEFVADSNTPLGSGALELTASTPTGKAQLMTANHAGTQLDDVTQLSYWTKRISGPNIAAPSYQLQLCLGGVVNGGCVGFTTMVYEPYQNGTVHPTDWQFWNVDSGQFWSSRTYTDGQCTVMAGFGGAPFYTLQQLQQMCPNAVVGNVGVNVGSNNSGFFVRTDGFNFNGTVYNFELTNVPTNKDACKKDGYKNMTDANGNPFKNQGQCVSYVASNGRSAR